MNVDELIKKLKALPNDVKKLEVRIPDGYFYKNIDEIRIEETEGIPDGADIKIVALD